MVRMPYLHSPWCLRFLLRLASGKPQSCQHAFPKCVNRGFDLNLSVVSGFGKNSIG